LMLVYEKFNNWNFVNVLLGADVFFEVLRHNEKTWPGNFSVLQDADLGWIISGKISWAASEEVPRKSFFFRNIDILDQTLQRFWEIEELPNMISTTEEILCDEHFKKHIERDDAGRYFARLSRREG
jgi:hypothetical protein